jgi:hypothetical protein
MLGEIDPSLIAGWSNPNRKYLVLVERHFAALARRVAELAPGAVTLAGPPGDAVAEMERLRASAFDPEEALRLVGTYYAYHFLTMNQRRVEALQLSTTRKVSGPPAYRATLLALAEESHALAAGFVSAVATLFGGAPTAGYLICNVGAVWDHEDLDLWAVASTSEDVAPLGVLCAQLAREGLRWALRVQFYLSEYLPENRFAGTMADYRCVLDRDLKNFVVVSQLLQATRLAGEELAFGRLCAELKERYLQSEPPTPEHEGFLRGALGEATSLAGLPERWRLLDPKAEIYRLVRILLACQGCRFRLPVASPWEALRRAAVLDSRRAMQYEALGRALDFAEVLRYLVSLFHVQEMPILLDNPGAQKALGRVALLMGYGDDEREGARALLVDYRAHRAAVKAAAQSLGGDLKQYLQSISVFYQMLRRHTALVPFDAMRGNLARVFLRYAETHQGRVFWEDVVAMCQDEPRILDRWVRDLARLRGRQLRWTAARYAHLLQEEIHRFLEFLLILERGPSTHGAVGDLLLDEAILLYDQDDALLDRFVDLFGSFPALVSRFVETMEPQVTARLVVVLRKRWDSRRHRKAGVRLLSLLNLYHFSSSHAKRHSARVLARHPEAVTFLDDFGEMRRMADTVMNEALEQTAGVALRQRLGDFYDLEFCRLSLMMLSAVDLARVGREFRRSSDRYVAALFEACVQEVAQAEGLSSPLDLTGFALFATGGNAREDPYDADYDLFAVLSPSDPRRKRLFNRVLARLSQALLERGIVVQNRFGERVGAHLCTAQELVEILRAAPPDAFIEKTELLGSRRILGDPAMDQILTEEVVRPFVFEDVRYPLDLVAELRARRQAGAAEEMEIKETPGGLRDVAILLAILKARLQLRWPDGPALYARLRLEMPALSEVIEDLEKTATFLRRLRAVYRLTLGSEDRLAPSYFGILALFMGYGHYPGGGAAELLGDYRAALGRVRLRLRECLGALGLPTEGI